MMRTVRRTVPALVFVVVAGGVLAVSVCDAAQEKRDGKKDQKTEQPKKRGPAEKYNVVQVGEELRVVKTSELASLKKSLAEKHKQALKSWEAAKKAAAKAKQKFTTPKPKPVAMKVVSSNLPSEQAAAEKVARLKEGKSGGARRGSGRDKKGDKENPDGEDGDGR